MLPRAWAEELSLRGMSLRAGGGKASGCHVMGAHPKQADKIQTRISCLTSQNPQQDRCALGQATNTELCVSLLPPPPQVPSAGTRSQGAMLQLQGKEAPLHPFLVLYSTFLESLPCINVKISTHPFAWKPHFHKTTWRDVFLTFGHIKKTRGFCSAIAGQMLHSHLKYGHTCQKTEQCEGTQVETP